MLPEPFKNANKKVFYVSTVSTPSRWKLCASVLNFRLLDGAEGWRTFSATGEPQATPGINSWSLWREQIALLLTLSVCFRRYAAHALYLILVEMHSIMGHKLFVHCAGHSLGGWVLLWVINCSTAFNCQIANLLNTVNRHSRGQFDQLCKHYFFLCLSTVLGSLPQLDWSTTAFGKLTTVCQTAQKYGSLKVTTFKNHTFIFGFADKFVGWQENNWSPRMRPKWNSTEFQEWTQQVFSVLKKRKCLLWKTGFFHFISLSPTVLRGRALPIQLRLHQQFCQTGPKWCSFCRCHSHRWWC